MTRAQIITVEKLRKAYSRNGAFVVQEIENDQVLVTYRDGADHFIFVETIDIRGIGYPN